MRRAAVALGDNTALVRLALGGGSEGRHAWNRLIDNNSRAVWKALWSYPLNEADRHDAFQCTWLRALENLHQVREPAKLHVWLMIIAGREASKILRLRNRVVPTEDGADQAESAVESEVLELDERVVLARAALARMTPECRSLLRLLTEEQLTYRDIEQIMGWANGGTAIRRSRCLEKLRETPEIRTYLRSIGRLNAREDQS